MNQLLTIITVYENTKATRIGWMFKLDLEVSSVVGKPGSGVTLFSLTRTTGSN